MSYFISEKDRVLVVVFAGSLGKDSQGILESCQSEVLAKKPAHVILMFRDLSDRVHPAAVPALARMKSAIRALPSELQICGLHPAFAQLLSDKGLLRVEETSKNLHEALQNLVKQSKQPKSRG